MKDILAAAKSGNWRRVDGGAVELVNHRIEPGEYEVRFQARQGLDATSFDGNAGVAVLDTQVTRELEREGVARDFIRMVQMARKDAGFNVADRIHIEVKAGPVAAAAIEAHLDAVKAETLAVSFGKSSGAPAGFVSEQKLQDEPIAIGVRVAG
jgi:isoleucyl-tRNA synthetase